MVVLVVVVVVVVVVVSHQPTPCTHPTSSSFPLQDYLLKMYADLDFVYDLVGVDASTVGNFCSGNPLLLSEDELRGRGERAILGRAHAAGE